MKDDLLESMKREMDRIAAIPRVIGITVKTIDSFPKRAEKTLGLDYPVFVRPWVTEGYALLAMSDGQIECVAVQEGE